MYFQCIVLHFSFCKNKHVFDYCCLDGCWYQSKNVAFTLETDNVIKLTHKMQETTLYVTGTWPQSRIVSLTDKCATTSPSRNLF